MLEAGGKLGDGKGKGVGSRHIHIPFQQMADKRQFDKIIDVLQKENSETLRLWFQDELFPFHNNNPAHSSLLTRETPLHYITSVQPPVCLVEMLVKCLTAIYKNAPEDVADICGRTPLHVATTYGCSSGVVRILATSATAAVMLDSWHRCPLHWACMHNKNKISNTTQQVGHRNHCSSSGRPNHCNSSSSNNKTVVSVLCCPITTFITKTKNGNSSSENCINSGNDEMIDAVRILIQSYPEATVIRDCNGMTPVDLAYECEADPRIVALVDAAAQQVRHGRRRRRLPVEEEEKDHGGGGLYNNNWCEDHFDENDDDIKKNKNDGATSLILEVESFPKGFPGEINVIDFSCCANMRSSFERKKKNSNPTCRTLLLPRSETCGSLNWSAASASTVSNHSRLPPRRFQYVSFEC